MSECKVCGASESLHVHHINGDNTDDREENLVTLCVRHHKSVHGGKTDEFEKDAKVLNLAEQLPEKSEQTIKCHNCDYVWDSETVNDMATCPSCTRKTPVDPQDES